MLPRLMPGRGAQVCRSVMIDFNNPAGLIGFINDQHGMAKLRPDHTFVYRRSWEDPEYRLQGVFWLAKQIATLAKAAEN